MHAFKLLAGGTALLAGLLLTPGRLAAHDSPEHEVDELTERIAKEGESADLLLERAVEYNVLGKSAEAAKDLERALNYEAHSPIIQRELSRAYLSLGKTNEALDAATRGLKYASDGGERASILILRCEVYRTRSEFPKALADADQAVRELPENAEPYLTRSQLQRQLGMKKDRIRGLEEGFRETASGMIEAELLDALIDGGKPEVALKRIEEELKDSRLRSSWLIRRARAFSALKKSSEAKADLNEALKELEERMSVGRPDPLLLVDRGHVYELLGNKEEAKKDYESARDKGVNDEWLKERIKAVKGEDKKKEDDKGKSKDKEKKSDAKETKDDESAKQDGNADDKKSDEEAK